MGGINIFCIWCNDRWCSTWSTIVASTARLLSQPISIGRAVYPSRKAKKENPSASTACLFYVKNVTDRIIKLLKKKDISHNFHPSDENHPFTVSSVQNCWNWQIFCNDFFKVYVLMTKRFISIRKKENKRALRLKQYKKLVFYTKDTL